MICSRLRQDNEFYIGYRCRFLQDDAEPISSMALCTTILLKCAKTGKSDLALPSLYDLRNQEYATLYS